MNKVILMGRPAREPELRYVGSESTAVCKFTLAVNRRFAKAGEERKADFIPIVAWNKVGEFCGKYFQKGQQICIVGRIETRSWDDAEGKKHYVTEVVAEEAYFAESKKSQNRDQGNAPDTELPVPGFEIDDDDELPF